MRLTHENQYPASASISGVSTGARDVVSRLQNRDRSCPKSKFALVGYSQGAAVMHSAAKNSPSAIQNKILAVVMYGDPGLKSGQVFPPKLQSKLLENCEVRDSVSVKSLDWRDADSGR
jgi:cutinase